MSEVWETQLNRTVELSLLDMYWPKTVSNLLTTFYSNCILWFTDAYCNYVTTVWNMLKRWYLVQLSWVVESIHVKQTVHNSSWVELSLLDMYRA